MDAFITDDSYIIFIRILIAAFLAGLIGMEREYKRHPAGFRTHLLVGTGACLAMLMALFGFQPYLEENADISAYDPSRLASYVISGVGFLGAGTIIVQGASIRGLTTAASIWVVAAIGLAAGAGMYFAASFTTLLVLLSLLFLNHVDRFFSSTKEQIVVVQTNKKIKTLSALVTVFETHDVMIKKIKGTREKVGEKEGVNYTFEVSLPKGADRSLLHEELQYVEGILEIEMRHSRE
ncbi:MgtC/SapB family protein [Alteribacillus sp. HJP-4]|uniref:MgtC/SapB family protein n=1 Tax=Alteribacillus sp. HJP-4 TaxID=2775394 RepID=UPI0035CD124A